MQGSKPYLEIHPANEMCSEQGMHGESRIHISPESLPGGGDFLADSWKHPPDKSVYHPHTGRMLLDLVMDDDCIWALMWKTTGRIPGPDHPYFCTRSRSDNCRGGWPAGWQRIGEGKSPLIFTAPFVKYRKEKLVLGVLRIGCWHYQKIDSDVEKDAEFTIKWKCVHARAIAGSPFKAGGAWWPMYAGKWRLISRINGEYHTTRVTVAKKDVGGKELTFKAPSGGKLEYVVFYIYDRTEETPESLWTIRDIYRDAIEGKPFAGR